MSRNELVTLVQSMMRSWVSWWTIFGQEVEWEVGSSGDSLIVRVMAGGKEGRMEFTASELEGKSPASLVEIAEGKAHTVASEMRMAP